MFPLGRIRQHRLSLLTTCLVISLVLMVIYLIPHKNKQEEINPDNLKDDNGIPLFLHDNLEDDQHRNSLKNPRPIRMKLSFRRNDDLKHLLREQAEAVEPRRNHPDEILHLDKREVRFQRNKLKAESEKGHGLLLNALTDNARKVMTANSHNVIPLKLLKTKPPKVPLISAKSANVADSDKLSYGQSSDTGYSDYEEKQMSVTPKNIDGIDQDSIKVLFGPDTMCEENREVYMLISVISDIRRYKLRDAIRSTWGRSVASGRFATKLIFVVGKPQEPNSALYKMILAENKQYGDILYLDIEDSHTILTYKTLSMFQWILEYCNQAKFILKTDDDVFINIPNILQDLKVMEGKQPIRFMLGHVIEGAKPITDRHDKWFMPGGQFKGKVYPTYLSGSAYILPSTLLEPLMQQSRETQKFWLEDVFITGILAEDIKATLIHNSKFEFRKRKLGPCRFKKLNSAHELTPEDLMFVWRELNRGSLKCANTDGHFLKSIDYEP